MHVISKTIQVLKDEIQIGALLRGILVLVPFAVIYLHNHNPIWLQTSVLTMSTLIVEERLELTALGVLLHGFIIIVMFYFLFLTQPIPVLYIVSCTLAATTVILVTIKGEKLRPLGNWTFIPAIILATEFAAETNPTEMLHRAPQFLPYLLFALVPTVLLAQFDEMRTYYKKREIHYHPLRLGRLNDFGEQNPYIENMIAMAIAVCISTFLVEYFQMDNGQWMIWGTASVVTGNVTTSPKKLSQRIIGVSLGVPLGILFGLILPSTPLALTLAICGIFLTLVAFRRYVIAYSFRCFFVATTVMLVTHSASVASERLTHVILGGLVGFGSVIFCHLAQSHWVKK
ncbi:FUSC family protein [Legionella sp. WA2024007413]